MGLLFLLFFFCTSHSLCNVKRAFRCVQMARLYTLSHRFDKVKAVPFLYR